MKVTHEFEVSRPLATVWDFFQDIPEVAQCLPGAELISSDDNGGHTGKVSIKMGPLSATFEGTATVTTDPATHTGLIAGLGTDRRGGSRGSVKVAYRLVPDGDAATKVSVDADVVLSGAAAQFGRGGLITEMSNRLISQFVECVEGKLAATTVEQRQEIVAPEVKGLSLFWQSLLSWVKSLFGGRKTSV